MVSVTLTNEDFGYVLKDEIAIDFDTFKLKSREIGKVRSLFRNALTHDEQLFQEIELLKERIESDERWLVTQKEELANLTKKYASLNPMKEVA